jgi:malic enzyme
VWITPAHKGRIYEVLGNTDREDVRLIVVTDNERILGLGDQGAGGMVIPIGKLALYTLGAGIHPAHTLPVSLDVGTDNEGLLADDLYVGWPHPRLRGPEYDALVDEFVEAVRRRWPRALLQWEDFKKANAFRLLDRYRGRLASFNDDIQGTGAVAVAGVLAACRATKTKLTDQRALLVGAGAAGVGIARHLRHTMAVAGGEPSNVALWDTRGLVIDDRQDLDDFKAEMAWSASSPALPSREGRNDLARFVAEYRPTAIIGTTGQQGLFDEQLMTTMAGSVERPLVMAMSNPTSNCEAIPSDIVDWTDGRALIATGSPFGPVDHAGTSIPISQCNNVYVFPGVGLGAIVSGATAVTDTMFAAAADTLAALTTDDDLEAGKLYPPVGELRSVSRRIAVAVAAAAGDGGVGRPLSDSDLAEELDRIVWDLEYPELRPT